jgi:hypothetical protein
MVNRGAAFTARVLAGNAAPQVIGYALPFLASAQMGATEASATRVNHGSWMVDGLAAAERAICCRGTVRWLVSAEGVACRRGTTHGPIRGKGTVRATGAAHRLAGWDCATSGIGPVH